VVNVIRALQRLGMTLEEIKALKDRRTPKLTDAVLEQQIEKIDSKIDEWLLARKLLLTIRDMIHSVSEVDENVISIQYMPAEAIILGDLNDFSRKRELYDALLDFYQQTSKKYPQLDLNYPVWAVFSEEQVKKGVPSLPERFYFHNPEGQDKRPASLYAVGYSRGGYGQTEELYKKMRDYIDASGFEICGNTYEEYPLNEVCIAEDNNYLIRIMITVREK